MSGTIFLDSNVLIYLYSKSDPVKQRIARDLIFEENCVTGMNNLNEMNHVLSRKKLFPASQLHEAIETLLANVSVKPVGVAAVFEAVRIMNRYRYSYFDSLVIAMALEHGCDTLCTEDMQNSHLVENRLTIRNVFLGQ